MIYERGNSAKQWILKDIGSKVGSGQARILDLGCGDGHLWKVFAEAHPSATIVGVDADREAIERGQKAFEGQLTVRLRVYDAQNSVADDPFDFVTALSTIEHVVDRPAFLVTVWNALRKGGTAYLNYDVGHFRSRDIKERLMVPVSQALAAIGIEGPYMKKVDNALFRSQAEKQGFLVVETKKHNVASLKGFMRGAGDEALQVWFDYERRLNEIYQSDKLDSIMLSTTLVVKKP